MLKTNLKQVGTQHAASTHVSHYLLACSLLVMSTQVFASSEPTSKITDSVFAWGMWEYNIAPAAGNLQSQNASPLNPRSAKVTLRTNSNAALAPTGTAELAPNIRPFVPPVTPPAPVTPPPPIIITQAPTTIPAPLAPTPPTISAPPTTTPSTITPPPSSNIGTSSVPSISGTSF